MPPSPELLEEERQAAAKAAAQAAVAGARGAGHKGDSPQKGAKQQPPKEKERAAPATETAAHTSRDGVPGSSGAASGRPVLILLSALYKRVYSSSDTVYTFPNRRYLDEFHSFVNL